MTQPATDPETEAANETERNAYQVPEAQWDAAFAWADADGAADAGEASEATTRAPARLDGAFVVWTANWDTVQLFLLCQTQWQEYPMGGLKGFDYVGVNVVLGHRTPKRRRTPEFERLQQMEFAALEACRGG